MKQKLQFLNFHFYHIRQILVALFICNAITIAQESIPNYDFPVVSTIFDTISTNTALLDSFEVTGFNTIWQRADDSTKSLLEQLNLCAVNAYADTEYIYHYSTAYYSKWNAEQNQTDLSRVGVKHSGGSTAFWYDPELSEMVLCWSTIGLSAPASSLMYGPHYRQEKRYKRWYYGCVDDEGCVTYTPRFRMALDNHSGADLNEVVCVIKVVFRYKDRVTEEFHDTTFIQRTLKVGDFDTTGTFDYFYLNPIIELGRYDYWPGFNLDRNHTEMLGSQSSVDFIDWESYTGIQFCVDWLRDDTLCTLYIDYAEVYDNNGWNDFVNDPNGTAYKITTYAESFSDWDNIRYWSGVDEPYSIDCYTPIRVVDEILQSNDFPPLMNTVWALWTLELNGEDEVLKFFKGENLDKCMFNYLPKDLMKKKYLKIENLK